MLLELGAVNWSRWISHQVAVLGAGVISSDEAACWAVAPPWDMTTT